jgi:hypothetical protein
MSHMIGIDQGVNLKKLRQLQAAGIVVLYQAHDLEQQFRRVAQQGRPFQLDRSTLDVPTCSRTRSSRTYSVSLARAAKWTLNTSMPAI